MNQIMLKRNSEFPKNIYIFYIKNESFSFSLMEKLKLQIHTKYFLHKYFCFCSFESSSLMCAIKRLLPQARRIVEL